MASPRRVEEGMLRQGPDFNRIYTDGRAFCGRTTLGSGSASVTVSTGVINSNSMFRLASIVGSTALGANSGGGVVVNSIVSGVSFALARPTGTAVAWSDIVSWEIVRTGMK